ncbi:Spermidine/putrescine transport system permease [Paracholeplasma brassicae]|uniref:Spermidine/putrescine transport system permease n=1 Tax=Acholeplasma brassicae TaxID=61635 RepID=U4KPR3_9MOLU|nr:ABC transporter permease [Paracholeplasma brassicae]CCV66361.1 Spermidine/putrescine transport system permease [Paracholeplasma brassicae]
MNNKAFRLLAKPYFVWLYVLALVPVFVMLFLSFVKSEGISFDEMTVSLESFLLVKERSTLIAFRNSLLFALSTTVISMVIGYFVAYRVFKSKFNNKFLVLTILILPMWSNLLLRTEALGNIMEYNNIYTDLLSKAGINAGISIRGTSLAVLIGLVFTYLPFMILPIYTALEKISVRLEEASLDLGLTEFQTFWKVTFPLSLKGLISGSIMVFLPTLSGFAIPQILGKGNIILIGNVIEESFKNMNYNFGSLLAVIILFFIIGALLIINKVDKDGETLL